MIRLYAKQTTALKKLEGEIRVKKSTEMKKMWKLLAKNKNFVIMDDI